MKYYKEVSIVDMTTLYSDYDKAKPAPNYYLNFHYLRRQLPEQGTYQYFQFLALLKLLECKGEFNKDMLSQFSIGR